MTQQQLIKHGFSLHRQTLSQSTQTSIPNNDLLFIQLDKNKTARLYFSSAYKNNVLCLNCGNSKNFIFTRCMWNDFKKEFDNINNLFNNDRNSIRSKIYSPVLHDHLRPITKRKNTIRARTVNQKRPKHVSTRL